ncbi:MAG: CheW-like domain protein [Spirochaetes bacterium ADurb.Bin269]|jgi:purine-binding chemotaxis protein CheW|nr:MAG: CheW-like domain protein [Spirochaetes bacterium ADurb.Bin269]HPX48536.1 chemotaxis protein CheW [Treponemataceae bacterium]
MSDEPVKYLLFTCGDTDYAIPSLLVREIVSGLPVYPVPFVPTWVRGLLNRHGEPFVVLDPEVLFGRDPLKGSTALLLSVPGDQVSLRITDVCEFLTVPESDLHRISAPDESAVFFLGAVTSSRGDVFVLNIHSILERLAVDVGSS